MDMVRWTLKDYLQSHNLSTYALVRSSGLAPNTVYSLARGEQNQIRLDTIAGVLGGLRELVGHEVALTDILVHEVRSDAPEDDLHTSSTADLAATLEDLEHDLPEGEIDEWLETFYAAADLGNKHV